MQPGSAPPEPCPKCGQPVLRDLFSGEPVEPEPTISRAGELLFRWHLCAPRSPKESKPRPLGNKRQERGYRHPPKAFRSLYLLSRS